MTRPIPVRALAFLLVGTVLSAAAGPAAPPAPAAGSPAVYLPQAGLAETMRLALAKSSEPALAPIGVTDQYFINEVHRGAAGAPAVHPGWTELHFILEGSGTFVTGGTITAGPGGTSSIQGGISRKVSKGDAIIVPANTPHWYQQIDGALTAIEVRFIAPGTPYPPK
ncbi:MAG: Cupin 2 conserved barrel domain protein [Gammaproteobacteria bacterium]|nr:Cupin 2 conserved barrel domain protein [Gammaproteobacteria bacterium]